MILGPKLSIKISKVLKLASCSPVFLIFMIFLTFLKMHFSKNVKNLHFFPWAHYRHVWWVGVKMSKSEILTKCEKNMSKMSIFVKNSCQNVKNACFSCQNVCFYVKNVNFTESDKNSLDKAVRASFWEWGFWQVWGQNWQNVSFLTCFWVWPICYAVIFMSENVKNGKKWKFFENFQIFLKFFLKKWKICKKCEKWKILLHNMYGWPKMW